MPGALMIGSGEGGAEERVEESFDAGSSTTVDAARVGLIRLLRRRALCIQ